MSATYSPCRMVVSVAGRVIEGFSENDIVSVTRDTNLFTKTIGAAGEVARAKHCNTAGTITISLLQTSQDNDFLSSLANTDHATGKGQVPVYIEDQDGSTKYASTQAWVQKMPDADFGNDIRSRVWVFDCADLSIHHGGNNTGVVASTVGAIASAFGG